MADVQSRPLTQCSHRLRRGRGAGVTGAHLQGRQLFLDSLIGRESAASAAKNRHSDALVMGNVKK